MNFGKQSQPGQQPPPGANQPSNNWWRVALFILAWFLIIYMFRPYGGPQPVELTYTEFKSMVRRGDVAQATFRGQEISGQLEKGVQVDGQTDQQASEEKAQSASNDQGDASGEGGEGNQAQDQKQGRPFHTVMPTLEDPELMTLLEKNDVIIRAETQETPWLVRILVSVLPWVLIIGFFIWSSKKLQERMGGGPGGGIFGFGKSKAKLYDKSSSEASFEDVAGLSNAKKELEEIIGFLKEPERYRSLGAELPRGILLVGPPGTGKTLMAKAVAGEADAPFFNISGSEFIEMFVGVGASRVRDMFKDAKKNAPSIIFIDEIDSIGRVRGSGVGGGHDEREQTLNQILNEMDGFSPHESVVVMAATNRPDVLDAALVRPGRFDRRVTLNLPRKKARKEILEVHVRDVTLAEEVDLSVVADRTTGFSGADLENLVNEAALLAAREGKKQVEQDDFAAARDKILMGIEREDVISDEEKELIAYHEAGHAMMARMLPGADPLGKVTIVPRGQSLGATEQIPEENRYTRTRDYLLKRVAILLGGRAAERLTFEDVSTGAADDLKKATQMARRMVCQWGMSEKLGSTTFRQGEDHPFLGREISEPKDFSEHTGRIIDEEVQRIIAECEAAAMENLSTCQNQLKVLAEALLEHETLTDAEIDEILAKNDGEEACLRQA